MVSVRELEEYWEYRESLKDGDTLERHIGTYEMPPWDEICSELSWHFDKVGRFSRKGHGYCGVYRIIGLATDKAFKPAAISRACGEDVSGTLYVGESRWLNERLNQFRRSLRGEDTHGASRLWRQSMTLKSKFPSNQLGIATFFTRVRMHEVIESDLIRAYLDSFGDTPPLNCSF
jgi:hypothetical protein